MELRTGECLHCEKPIREILPYPNARTPTWMHVEGTHAYEDCRGLKATPKGGTDDGGRHRASKAAEPA